MILGIGNATLVAGTATVSLPGIPANATVLLTRTQDLGTIGDIKHDNVVVNTSFTIKSLNILDTSTVHWMVFV